MLTNKQFTPEEKTIYFYEQKDGKAIGAYGRIGENTFATAYDIKEGDTKEILVKVKKRLIMAVSNSLTREIASEQIRVRFPVIDSGKTDKV